MASIRRWGAFALFTVVGCGGAAFSTGSPDASGDDGGHLPDASDGATDAGACVTATVTFELRAASGKSFCVGGNALACATDWLSVRAASGGSSLTIDRPCLTTCGSCQPMACPAIACAAPAPLAPAGVSRAWDGTHYAAGTCGAGVSCVDAACASPGTYIATMCGYARLTPEAGLGACTGATTATCVDVAFDWQPAGGQATVTGTLGAPTSDAGACCPSAWEMYTCTFPDGGSGEACHNPALGCASSTVCGQGCDSVVTGRCADGG